MVTDEWVRNHPGAVEVFLFWLVSIVLAKALPIADTTMLINENVIQLIGVLLAGQLAVLALTVPAVLELRAKVLETGEAKSLGPMIDVLMKELKSNTRYTFVVFASLFASSIVFEANKEWLSIKLLLDVRLSDVFCATKITFVVVSCMAMWDSIEPLFGIGEAMTELRKIANKH